MEVKINKEISDYSEGFFFGFSLKQTFFLVLAAVSGVVTWFLLKDTGISMDIIGIICVMAAVPFAYFGFFSYHGMGALAFAMQFIRWLLLSGRPLPFRAVNEYEEMFRLKKNEVRPKVKNNFGIFRRPEKVRKETELSDEEKAWILLSLQQDMDTVDNLEEEEINRKMRAEKRRKRAIGILKDAGSWLIDIVFWAVISILLTYLVNKTDLIRNLFR